MSLQHDVDLMNEADVEEAASRKFTLPAGKWEAQVIESKGIETDDMETFAKSGDQNPYYGLPGVFLTMQLFNLPRQDGSTYDVKQGVKVCRHKVVTSKGLGIASRNYAGLSKALGLGAPTLEDLEAKALIGPRFVVVVGKKGYIDGFEAA